jgi:hypothetical protein
MEIWNTSLTTWTVHVIYLPKRRKVRISMIVLFNKCPALVLQTVLRVSLTCLVFVCVSSNRMPVLILIHLGALVHLAADI